MIDSLLITMVKKPASGQPSGNKNTSEPKGTPMKNPIKSFF